MDILASRLARDANIKSKSNKGVKRLSKNGNKENKKKSISKVDSKTVEKPLKNQKILSKEVSSKKKQLIKDALIKIQDNKKKNLLNEDLKKSVLLKKQPKVSKPKKVVKDDSNSVDKNKKVLKSSKKLKNLILKSSDKLTKQISKSDTVLKGKPFDSSNSTSLKKTKSQSMKSTKVKSNEDNQLNSRSIISLKPKSSKKAKLQSTKPVKVHKNEDNQLKANTDISSNSKSIKKTKSQSMKLIKVKNNENNQINTKSIISSNSKTSKKAKSLSTKPVTESVKPLKMEVNEEIKNIKSKKRKQSDIVEEQIPGLNLNKKEVIKYVKALIKVVENEKEKKKALFDSEKPPILLHINCFKIPKVPLHQYRIHLPHLMVSATDDIALFVKDLKKGRKRDYEDTVHHYEDILQKHNVTGITAIIPINQVKTEYRQFEMRRRLFNSYDHFLVDGSISGHMAHLLGKYFRERRKLPTSIHMQKKNLKEEIDNALHKTSLQIHGHGDSSIMQVGTCAMKVEHIADNILAVVEDLSKNFPGGWANIRSLRIKTPLSLAIPIYITLKSKNEVEVPVLTPKRPKAYEEVEGELSTFTSNVKVYVAPDGSVRVQKLDNDESDEDTNENKEESNISKNDIDEDEDEEDDNED